MPNDYEKSSFTDYGLIAKYGFGFSLTGEILEIE